VNSTLLVKECHLVSDTIDDNCDASAVHEARAGTLIDGKTK
jgi:hypothetical protein